MSRGVYYALLLLFCVFTDDWVADETEHRRQWPPDRWIPAGSYRISIWVVVEEGRYPPALHFIIVSLALDITFSFT